MARKRHAPFLRPPLVAINSSIRSLLIAIRFSCVRSSRKTTPTQNHLHPRENQLLSPHRQPLAVTIHPPDGVIITDQPDQMWGTNPTATITVAEGNVTVFAAIDHCTAECIGIHTAKKANRFEALDPVRQGVRDLFGAFSPNSAVGLRLRHDNGSVYFARFARSIFFPLR